MHGQQELSQFMLLQQLSQQFGPGGGPHLNPGPWANNNNGHDNGPGQGGNNLNHPGLFYPYQQN